ncbi:hypothetical protein KY359_00465 [Candidatus Woesearchaeota archaeon]|nr:hypothetical protein [Candidatus Woesearchaeota archaeon]
MKKGWVSVCIALLLLVVAGCGFLPSKPPIEGAGEDAEPAAADSQPATAAPKAPEAAADDIIEQVAQEKKYVPVEPEIVNETNETEEELRISGSLRLQSNPELCPHLIRKFECDKYDLARCDSKTLVGQNDFYPDIISCWSGYDYRGEDPNHKYCFIQECRPLDKDSVVYAYGGTVAYAEYLYEVEKVEGGINTKYTLHECGEEFKEFPTSFDCRVYKSDIKTV